MTTALTVLAASFIGQLAALWLIGTLAHRSQMKQARKIERAIEEAEKEAKAQRGRLREYIKMES